MSPLVIIPARYASSRFPGKPLAMINGKPMVQHVYERCKSVFDLVVIATDDDRIVKAANRFGAVCVMSSSSHKSGTDRCAEVALKLSSSLIFDTVINVQGDEPFIEKDQLLQIAECFNDKDTDIATLITPITTKNVLFDTNKVKVVISKSGFALYFSRQPIPFQRDLPSELWTEAHKYFGHLGMYGFKSDVLQKISKLKPSSLEMSEKLEQLRWLENGYSIKTAFSPHENLGIDTREDLERLLRSDYLDY